MRKTDESIKRVESLQKNLVIPKMASKFSESQSDRSHIDVNDKRANVSANPQIQFDSSNEDSPPKPAMMMSKKISQVQKDKVFSAKDDVKTSLFGGKDDQPAKEQFKLKGHLEVTKDDSKTFLNKEVPAVGNIFGKDNQNSKALFGSKEKQTENIFDKKEEEK